MVAAANKAETLKEELENETALFQTSQDTLATEMLSFVAKEHDLSDWVTKVRVILYSWALRRKRILYSFTLFLYFYNYC